MTNQAAGAANRNQSFNKSVTEKHLGATSMLPISVRVKCLTYRVACISILLATVFTTPVRADDWGVPQNPTGTWKGEWRSNSTGHRGPMRVVITPSSKGTYQARFTGRFAAVIPFAYRAELVPTKRTDGSTVLTSSKKLGPILGSYQMQTQVQGNALSGQFQAAGDKGSIQMQRIR